MRDLTCIMIAKLLGLGSGTSARLAAGAGKAAAPTIRVNTIVGNYEKRVFVAAQVRIFIWIQASQPLELKI